MHSALWVVQCLLGLVFGYSAAFKGTRAKDEIVAIGQTGVAWYGTGFIRFIALCEGLGAIGLILPWLLGTVRVLTPLAAIGLGIIMVGAAVSHARLAFANPGRRARELANVGTNVVLIGALAFVAVERLHML